MIFFVNLNLGKYIFTFLHLQWIIQKKTSFHFNKSQHFDYIISENLFFFKRRVTWWIFSIFRKRILPRLKATRVANMSHPETFVNFEYVSILFVYLSNFLFHHSDWIVCTFRKNWFLTYKIIYKILFMLKILF